MLLESLDDTLVVNKTKQPKGSQFIMTNIGAAMDAVARGVAKAVEREVTDATEVADKTALKDAAKIAAVESQPGVSVGEPVGKKRK